jgi:hypothetical protein
MWVLHTNQNFFLVFIYYYLYSSQQKFLYRHNSFPLDFMDDFDDSNDENCDSEKDSNYPIRPAICLATIDGEYEVVLFIVSFINLHLHVYFFTGQTTD